MSHKLPPTKRIFDLLCLVALAAFIVPVITGSALAIYLTDGRPVFYKSRRRIAGSESLVMAKFRTMRRDAESIANRSTVSMEKTRFLNIGIDSPLYTPVGRWIERLMLTETPQILYVLLGKMSLVGNRPLPENVIAALKQAYPGVEARFAVPTGLTGPVQLIGREAIEDADRLRVEAAYCARVIASYTMMLDVKILVFTVYIGLYPDRRFTVDEVLALIAAPSIRREAVAAVIGSLIRRRTIG